MQVAKPFARYNWLEKAIIYNKNYQVVPSDWIKENADVLLLLFTAQGVDKDRIIENFYSIYENVKYINLPIEVIYVPMDNTEEEMKKSYEEQANWFTLKFDDILVHELRFMYDITCIPHLLVMDMDCEVISTHGIMDLEQYGKNAVITWLSNAASTRIQRKLSKDAPMYGNKWKFLNVGANSKPDYHRKFSVATQDAMN